MRRPRTRWSPSRSTAAPSGDQGDGTWSVLVRGVAREVSDPAELRAARALSLEPWAIDGAADHYVRVEPTLITGRRIQSVA